VYGTPADVPAIVVPNLLLVREDMPAARACALAKLLIGQSTARPTCRSVHPAAREISRETAVKTEPVNLHEGAKQALCG